jgi:catechol 2,3-dioxygenase-like lactoylglutathione lyase family enzyme
LKPFVAHLQINVDGANLSFYKEVLATLGWRVVYEDDGMLGLGGEHGSSLWFAAGAKAVANDYDGPGVNHIALSAESQAEVDDFAEYLTSRGLAPIFETPRHRPEFSGEGRTYYQVMFESPDRVLFEIVYTGPKEV